MSKVSFEGRVVVVTGAGGALGRTYALDIARRGGAVVVNDLGGTVEGAGASRELADRVAAEIAAAGGRAIASYDTVETTEGAGRIISTAIETFGRVDAVINNAGNYRVGLFERATPDDLATLLSSHLVGTFNVTQAAWPHMKAQGYGRILFTSSSAGMFGIEMLSAYGAAKAGMIGLMNVLSLEGEPHGILCNSLMPNAISRMAAKMAEYLPPGATGSNPYWEAVQGAMAPDFTTGIAVYLASEACRSTRHIYSSLGGRIARVFVGLTPGWQGSREHPSTADDIAAHIDEIGDADHRIHIPEQLMDEYRIVVGET